MSIVIDRSALNENHLSLINKFLWITTDPPKYGKVAKFTQSKTVPFFSKKRFTKDEVTIEFIYLPMAFASIMFKQPPSFFRKNGWETREWSPKSERPPRDYQIPIIEKADYLLDNRNGCILGMWTGFGKTYTAYHLAAKRKRRTIVFTNRETLLPQWKKEGNLSTTARIYIVPDKSGLSKSEFDKDADVYLCMIQRHENIPQRIKREIGTVILDEAHLLCTDSAVEALLSCQPEYIIACTATLSRNDGMHRMVESMCGGKECIIKPTFQNKFYMIGIKTGIDIPEKFGAMGRDWNATRDDISNNEECNNLIYNFVKLYPDKKMILLTRLKDHAKVVSGALTALGESSDWLADNKTSHKNCRILVGTTDKIGNGYDAAMFCPDYDGKPIEIAVFLITTKSTTMFIQGTGRSWRCETPMVFVMVHNHTTIKNHWCENKKVFSDEEMFPKCNILEWKILSKDFSNIKQTIIQHKE